MDRTQEGHNKEKAKNTHSRRSVLKSLAGLPVLGLFSWELARKIAYDKKNRPNILRELGLEDIQPVTKNPLGKEKLIRIGMIGFGNRAKDLSKALGFMLPELMDSYRESGQLDAWMEQENLNVAITGICDVFDLHAEAGLRTAKNEVVPGGGKHPGLPVKRYRTYKEMLDDKSIDAVVIATPDHHHARITTDAVKAGKHVYCEKSISITEEGLFEVYEAVKNSDRVFQLGHQIPQNRVFQQAKELVKQNILGKITLIDTTTNRNSAGGAWIRHLDENGNPKPGNTSTIDWIQWLGNTPYEPFSIDRYYNWTKWFAYDTGLLGQLFSHEFDAVNQLLNIGIPASAMASGGIYYWQDNRDMADVLQVSLEYPQQGLTLLYSATLASNRSRGRVFMGRDASMELGDSMTITADKGSERYKNQIKNGLIPTDAPMLTISPGANSVDAMTTPTEQYYASRGLSTTVIGNKRVDIVHLHMREWLDCIRHGGRTSANIEMAFQEGIAILMAQKSYLEKRLVKWDPVKQQIV